MEPQTGKDFKELLSKAEHSAKTADHIVYITYPLIKDSQLLKKALEEIYSISIAIVQTTLSYEYMYKRVQLHQDPKLNWDNFRVKCAARFNMTSQEIDTIKELLALAEKHKESSMEFVRKEKVVIMSDNLRIESIGLDKLKKYLSVMKVVMQKTKAMMMSESPFMFR